MVKSVEPQADKKKLSSVWWWDQCCDKVQGWVNAVDVGVSAERLLEEHGGCYLRIRETLLGASLWFLKGEFFRLLCTPVSEVKRYDGVKGERADSRAMTRRAFFTASSIHPLLGLLRFFQGPAGLSTCFEALWGWQSPQCQRNHYPGILSCAIDSTDSS